MRFNLIVGLLILFSHNTFAAAKIQTWQTSQGSRVYYVQTPALPMVDIRASFDAGSARDGDRHGIAALTAALLDTGAGDWNADDIADRFESVGAAFSTGVSEDMAWLSLRSLSEPKLFDKAIDTFKTILTQPRFNAADFEREKNRTLAALKHREESPAQIAKLAFGKALYGDHPYAHPEEGYVETVGKLDPEQLKAFYRQYYVAANGIIVIIGDLDRQKAEQTAERLLSGLAKGEKTQPIAAVELPEKSTSRHIEFPSSQTHVLAGMPGTYRKDPDYFSLYVGNHILGGGGLVSQLFEEIREKRGLAYSASSQLTPLFRAGPFAMGLQTRNDQTDQAVALMQSTYEHFVTEGPSQQELDASKKNITGGFAMRIDTNGKLTDYVTMIGFYQQPLDYLETFQANVEAVTVESIRSAFARRLDPKHLQTISVGGVAKTGAK